MIIIRTFLFFLVIMATTKIALMEEQTYIIHMDKTKMTDSDHQQYYQAVIDSITKLSSQEEEKENKTPTPQLLYIYETAISGFAAKLSTNQLKSLNQVDGFLFAIPDELLSLHTTHTPQFLGLQNGKGLWSASNSASDVIVGLVDTGIWPEHVSFQDSGMSPVPSRWKGTCEEGTKFSFSNCNKKLIGARAFVQGYEAIVGRVNETVDYRSPRDSNGHGTHTASTAAGNFVNQASLFGLAKGSASGMKYTARIAAYKACWTSGCANSDVMAAIDSAVADGVDILSLSLGGVSKPYYKDNIAIASFGAIQHGVSVSCSAGNSGPSRSSVSNAAPWIMTVAASYSDRSFPTAVKLGDGQIFEGSSLYSGKKTKRLPLVYNRTAGSQGAEYCFEGSLVKKLVKGKIVVCEEGIYSRTEVGDKVKKAGGAGMLLLNSEDEGEELLADAHILPATSLGASAAKAIRKYVGSAKKPSALIVFQGTVYGNTAPVMAALSSRGPNSAGPDVIKPDVTAPGVDILAAWPPNISPSMLESDNRSVLFNIISGTSMSCPHVSGLASLLKSVHRDWSPAAIKSALMTTAYTLNNKGAPIADIGSTSTSKSATPFAFGSGHVDPENAADPGLVYDITAEDYLFYLCSLSYNSSQIALFSSGVNFTCPKNAVLQPGDLNYPSFSVLFSKDARNMSVTYKRTVKNVGKIPSTYAVQVKEPTGVSVTVEPRSLGFKKMGEKLSYKVSFVALGGPALTNSSFGTLTWVSGKYRVGSPIAVTWL
ncbi:PREDICTED: subtilisin-like protease SBT1.1 [Prunus mume]|uniref:Subtilisin-like protease SBT1.1 n=1 Tax=Prunus mume TaxID=102107 RepID=A0ABM0P0Z5_PRUMU|nr:PREDICTED: subtilisin-like protease SBT1.1 [Prunus mume]XP_008232841.1 PREDICTED: subtilisin-like protease SBT1.1 [Prunus mume]